MTNSLTSYIEILKNKIEKLEKEINTDHAVKSERNNILYDVKTFCSDCIIKETIECNRCSLHKWFKA